MTNIRSLTVQKLHLKRKTVKKKKVYICIRGDNGFIESYRVEK